jgi:hypothetical protein
MADAACVSVMTQVVVELESETLVVLESRDAVTMGGGTVLDGACVL